MTDVNERSFSAGSTNDKAAGRFTSIRQRIPAPIWRFRPAPAVVQTLRTQIIPKIMPKIMPKIIPKILPKIVLALRALPIAKTSETTDQQTNDIESFAALAVGHDDAAAGAYVDNVLASGMSVERVMLDLLAPAARHLGTLWESDATDFASVTLGVSRLQRIMRRLGESFFNEAPRTEGGESVLLTIIPGEQHSFGLSMVAEFFRRAGWNLCMGPFSSHRELTSLVQNHWFDVVGFSVSSDRRLQELKTDISNIRRTSRNQNISIMLGGPMTMVQPDLVAFVGADMMTADAATAPQQAHHLIQERTRSS